MQAPTNWLCRNAHSNYALQTKAEIAIKLAEVANGNRGDILQALTKFYIGWIEMSINPVHHENGINDKSVTKYIRDFGLEYVVKYLNEGRNTDSIILDHAETVFYNRNKNQQTR